MSWLSRGMILGLLFILGQSSLIADATVPTHREALKPFNHLIGSWRAQGTPEGTREEKRRGAWQETIRWEWQFKKDDAWLTVDFAKGKHFAKGRLDYLPKRNQFRLTVETPDKQELQFTGSLEKRRLFLERVDPKTKDTHRLVLSFLHDNRFLYQFEIKPAGRTLYRKMYLVGATKEGVPFAVRTGETGPFCVVSGGPPTTPVSYKGKTYYVCCGGCRSAFLDEPEKYIKEYEALLAKRAKGSKR